MKKCVKPHVFVVEIAVPLLKSVSLCEEGLPVRFGF